MVAAAKGDGGRAAQNEKRGDSYWKDWTDFVIALCLDHKGSGGRPMKGLQFGEEVSGTKP